MITGRVHKFGEDVNTDEIIAASHLVTTDPKELAKYCMEGIDKDFPNKVKNGDIIIAGWNFGCGSSREHAPLAIKGAGVACVIAPRFAGIFFRNAINIGLPIIELEVSGREEGKRRISEIKEGDTVKVDFEKKKIIDLTTGRSYSITPFPGFIQQIIRKGGLMKWLKSKKRRTK